MRFLIASLAVFLSYSRVAAADETPEEIQQLVAPIALYPDELVAQVLAASTHPDEVAEADQWMQQYSNLTTDQLAQAVDQQPWDPSVRALTEFPSVLASMDQSLAWTSALGDAFANQQQAVLDAVQVLRQRAESAGTLRSTPQQTVTTDGQSISIEPASPEEVYVPAYDPWDVYGQPLAAYPGWVPIDGSYLGVGISFEIGYRAGFRWRRHNWGFDWRGRRVTYNRGTYFPHSPTYIRPGGIVRGPGPRVITSAPRARYGASHGGRFHR